MNIEQLIDHLQAYEPFSKNVRLWLKIDRTSGVFAPFPDGIDKRIIGRYHAKGIEQLYSHQKETFDAICRGEDVIVVTPTASGKTLCYNLPVINTIVKNPEARALYLFPTKALSQDQLNELNQIVEEAEIDIKTYTFDGDTPTSARSAVRAAGNIVITNPDMLHAGILPHHTIWIKLFENLKYIVVDEVHSYRGVFGSHFANLMRRLMRVCDFYGSKPQFICCSATIHNPREHAESLIGRNFTLIDKNGSPHGDKHYIIYNPPVINEKLGIRASAVKEAAKVASSILLNKIPTIVFARSRLRVEIIYTYLQKKCRGIRIAGYRGGYLPNERRAIERGLREGSIIGVVSTNALELGIDVGMLDAAVTAGYPGSISSLHQQFGRAGRRESPSLAIMIATSSPLDQYIAGNPEFIIKANPESATINPDNILILLDHIKCASFEIPFTEDERFADHLGTTLEMLEFLEEKGILKKAGGKFHWMSDIYPANEVSLRTAAHENFVILCNDVINAESSLPADAASHGKHSRVIGEIDYYSAPTLIHNDAIYIHQGRQYYVDNLDWERRMAFCHEVESEYYTDAETKTDIHVLEKFDEKILKIATLNKGEINVRNKAIMFKKIRFNTHENLGWGKIHLPEIEMHTSAVWIDFQEEALLAFLEKSLMGRVLYSIAYIIRNISPVFTLSDYSDIHVVHQSRSNYSGKPSIFIYDSVPGGVGISERIFEILNIIIEESIKAISQCGCTHGCPACIGPLPGHEEEIKRITIEILSELKNESQG